MSERFCTQGLIDGIVGAGPKALSSVLTTQDKVPGPVFCPLCPTLLREGSWPYA